MPASSFRTDTLKMRAAASAIYKIQGGRPGTDQRREKNSVNIFLKPVVAENIVRENDYEPGEGEDYADRALRVAEQQKRRRVSARLEVSTN